MTKKMRCWWRLVFCLLVVGMSFWGCHLPVRISDYRGDGAITRLRNIRNPGFQVHFEKFSLASPYKAAYRVDDLPQHFYLYHVGLLPELARLEGEQWIELISEGKLGKLSLRLLDGAGEIIFDASMDFSKLYWRGSHAGLFGEINSVDLPMDMVSTFTYTAWGPPPNIPAILEVTYEPGANSPERMANIQITAGGGG